MTELNEPFAPVVVVTGASAGVGRAIVHRFARAHWRIGLIARDADALAEVKQEVERLGGRALVVAADVSDAEAVFRAADEVARVFGAIDVWINDAMVTVFSPVWQITPEEFRRVTEVTYLGFVHGTMAALRHMRPAGRGHIVQIGSALAYRGIPLQSAYCGAKHAIRGFTDSLRAELIHERNSVRLTMMELPAVNTPQFDWARTHMPRQPRPVAPVVEPGVIAQAVFQAVQRPRREYWIGWSTIKVILGNMLLPAFLDQYLAKVAFAGQETSQSVEPDRPDNLMAPVHSLHRTRGRFGNEAGDRAIVAPGTWARVAPFVVGGIALLIASTVSAASGRGPRAGRHR
ncbi:SDR family oxidoreductase [Bradyrhizobium sp. 197]|uniref:SDR family oxidoreductase n=1 Tax=Bradyrhizobium sp. 197 TaxID=2782663 RepID=UPI001FFAB7B2|nr:SDR family oxidoreductase [Bradyrhizobium sp. 197]MCK1474950.1 SDR family oxidoreductase [Bradyrhizobium sp. 197]